MTALIEGPTHQTGTSEGRGGGQAIAVCAVTTIGSSASEKILSDLPTLSPTYAANLSAWLFKLPKYCRAQAYAKCYVF